MPIYNPKKQKFKVWKQKETPDVDVDSCIFGKDKQPNIVSIEVDQKNAEVILFCETKDGIETHREPHTFWLLSPTQYDQGYTKLDGNLHYQYIHEFQKYYPWKVERDKRKDQLYYCFDQREAAMIYNGYTYFKNMNIDDLSVLSFDIEAAGLLDVPHKEVYTIASTYTKNGKVIRKLFRADECGGEQNLIKKWVEWVGKMDPSVITGWNIFGYDLPYLQKCAEKYKMKLKLGRDGSDIFISRSESHFRYDGTNTWPYNNISIYGREIIDGMFLAVRYDIGRSFPSWKLKDCADHKYEEICDKVAAGKANAIEQNLYDVRQNRQFYEAENIRADWESGDQELRDLICQYCQHDSDETLFLFQIMIPPYFYLAPSIPKSFTQMITKASGSQINGLFIRSYLQNGYSIPYPSEKEPYEGAISYGNPGVYENVVKFDVASLYPSIMRQYKVWNKEKEPLGLFPKVVEYFTIERLKNKKLAKETGNSYYDGLQAAQKVAINSMYGFLGMPYSHFNSPYHAAFVTRKGREILQLGIEWCSGCRMEKYIKKQTPSKTEYAYRTTEVPAEERCKIAHNYEIVNVDTDSFSFHINQEPVSKEKRDELQDELNSLYPELIRWEDDGYFDRVVVLRAKNYVLNVGGKIKWKGSGIKATTKEKALQELIHDIIKSFLGMDDRTPLEIYESCVEEGFNVEDISRWCSKKSVTTSLLKAKRENEAKPLRAIEGEGLQIGDKFYVYFYDKDTLKLDKHFDGVYDKKKMMEKVYNTIKVFSGILDVKNTFKN